MVENFDKLDEWLAIRQSFPSTYLLGMQLNYCIHNIQLLTYKTYIRMYIMCMCVCVYTYMQQSYTLTFHFTVH